MNHFQKEMIQQENPLRLGVCSLKELEDRIKSFHIMNQSSIKKRYLLSRETVTDNNAKILLKKSSEIDISTVKLLRRMYPSSKKIKTFQPDEGIAIMSDMGKQNSIAFSMDLVTQILNIGGGIYEGFIERVNSFAEFLDLLKKVLFPRVLIIGHLGIEKLETEKIDFVKTRRLDSYMRMMEVTHNVYKPVPYFPQLKQINIDGNDANSWDYLIREIIREYTKPYYYEEISR